MCSLPGAVHPQSDALVLLFYAVGRQYAQVGQLRKDFSSVTFVLVDSEVTFNSSSAYVLVWSFGPSVCGVQSGTVQDGLWSLFACVRSSTSSTSAPLSTFYFGSCRYATLFASYGGSA